MKARQTNAATEQGIGNIVHTLLLEDEGLIAALDKEPVGLVAQQVDAITARLLREQRRAATFRSRFQFNTIAQAMSRA